MIFRNLVPVVSLLAKCCQLFSTDESIATWHKIFRALLARLSLKDKFLKDSSISSAQPSLSTEMQWWIYHNTDGRHSRRKFSVVVFFFSGGGGGFYSQLIPEIYSPASLVFYFAQ